MLEDEDKKILDGDEDDFEDEDGDIEENDLDHEKKDEENNPDKKPEPAEKPKQNRQENANFAKLRRELEEKEKRIKELEAKATNAAYETRKGIIPFDVLNELGLEEIGDEYDLLLAEEYMKASKKGEENPLLIAHKKVSEKFKTEKKELTSKQEQDAAKSKQEKENVEKVAADAAEFKKKFGFQSSEIVKDKNSLFMKIYGKQIDYGNLTELYTQFKALGLDGLEESEGDGKNKAVPPKPNGTNPPPKSVVKDDAYYDKVYKDYQKNKY